eukprot:17881-Eustigmatos_ZCMA.PRE.1
MRSVEGAVFCGGQPGSSHHVLMGLTKPSLHEVHPYHAKWARSSSCDSNPVLTHERTPGNDERTSRQSAQR